ncbi:hypothetical protein AYO21_11604 [Fonsecaea monophora]|uniref:Uncharacterized protein n=1 Tax=Fonsecaea monophora TaxID=254056 RepID=A0A177EQM6_9EURO|nr:hypothetical protein AYO21_11604 [Fonsecaea monophora]OAG34257.1 hypothetical protein AYO21_11604 [Fonsecaea monophora]
MSNPRYTPNEDKQSLVQDEEPALATGKADVFVDSTALVKDGQIIRIFSVLQSGSPKLTKAWLWVLVTAAFCGWTVSFAYAVFISPSPVWRFYDFSPRITVAVVNFASHLAVYLAGCMIQATFDAVCWTVISGGRGAPLRTFLVTKQDAGLESVASMLWTYGGHQLWGILKLALMVGGWVIGLPLLSGISYRDVFYPSQTVPVVGGIAPLRVSVEALEKASYGGQQPTFQEASINTMLISSTNSILTDPKFVVSVAPISPDCRGADCKSLFLPGGLELVLRADGTSLFDGNEPDDPVIIVHDAPGYQIEFSPQNYTFKTDVDCQIYGLPISALYACVAGRNDTIFSGFAICPFDLMSNGACQSDVSWTEHLQASVAMNIYQRTSTVAYDRANFSILGIESLGPAKVASDEESVADLQKLFLIMYPQLTTILQDIKTALLEFNSGQAWSDLAYLASVYCVQAEITAAELFLNNSYPSWVNGQRDILEGVLTIPIQFGTLLLQEIDKSILLNDLTTTASFAHVSFRVRSEPWTIVMFTSVVSGLVISSILCLLYAHWAARLKPAHEISPTIRTAFENGNPFEAPPANTWQFLSNLFCCSHKKYSSALQSTGREQDTYVVARKVTDELLIAVDREQDKQESDSSVTGNEKRVSRLSHR